MVSLRHMLLPQILIHFLFLSVSVLTEPEQNDYVYFRFHKQAFELTNQITPRPLEPSDLDPESVVLTAEQESNMLYQEHHWVQIIRQDDRWNPRFGIGIGFRYDNPVDTFPYRPDKAAIQFKSFEYGGQHFSQKDTANFSGIFNAISADVIIEITGYQADTISGTFKGVLISGSGRMAHLENGTFRIGLEKK
jgi:hypothetical protein